MIDFEKKSDTNLSQVGLLSNRLRGLLNFNILIYVSFQQDRAQRITRNREHGLNLNYTNPKLERSAHFYPVRVARLWNSLHLELRTKLTSPITLFQIKSI